MVDGSGEILTKHGSVRGVKASADIAPLESRLKLFRWIEPRPSPELEIGRFLTARRFARTPALVGALEYVRPEFEPGALAVVQVRIKHQGSGWDVAIDDLRRYDERVAARVKRSGARDEMGAPEWIDGPPSFCAAIEQWYLPGATVLGRRTAELHAALTGDPGTAFAPEPLDAEDLGALANRMRAHAEVSLDLLAVRLPSLDDVSRAKAETVLRARDVVLARFEAIRPLGDAGQRIRIHGDYHLGQVLRTEEEFMILDFDGDPSQSIAERRAKQSPLKDVAGMIRSYGYAAHAALFAFGVHAPDDYAALEPWAHLGALGRRRLHGGVQRRARPIAAAPA